MKKKFCYYCFLILLVFMISGCEPGSSYVKQPVALNLLSWNYPDTVKVLTPFGMYLSSRTENTCTSDLQFIIENYNDISFKVYALAKYESYNNNCDSLVVNKDTTISKSFSQIGKYYFYFLKENKWNKDSIIIIP